MMKLGCTSAMLTQKCSLRSRLENCRHDQKKHVTKSLKYEGDVDSFFYWKGIVHYEFVPRGETVNKDFYQNALKRLREAVRRKRSEAWTNNTWMLHHDNAPAHASLLIREFLMKHEMTCLPAILLSRFGPCGPFLVPEVEILAKR